MTDPLVSTEWLAERLRQDDVQIIDASWWMPAEGRSGRSEYAQAHIPGAIFFDIDAIADRTVDLPHMLLPPAKFAREVSRMGLKRRAAIVAYDSFGVRAAARLWWTLRAMAFPQVFVLDGGLKAWVAEGRPVESGQVEWPGTTLLDISDLELVRDIEAVRCHLDSRDAQIVDARGAARFRGEVPEPRAGLRSGHMPGALNVPFDSLLNADGRMKPAAELAQIFEAAGVDLDRPIVTTCGSGVTASVVSLALARLGRDRAAVYDGSWTEWGGRADTPVVTGP